MAKSELQYVTVFKSDSPDKWKATPDLAKRSITPPRVFEKYEVSVRSTLTIDGLEQKITERVEQLGIVKDRLIHLNAASTVTGTDDIIKQLDSEILNLGLVKVGSEVFLKYQGAIDSYEGFLRSGSYVQSLHLRETYQLDTTSAPVVHYAINPNIPVEVVGPAAINVLGVKTEQITEDVISKRSEASRSGPVKVNKGKLLHPLELEVLKNASEELLSTKTKAVVVDIFDKDSNGCIKYDDKTKIAQTHTIIFYKQIIDDNKQIFVIDPSNSDFSKHLDHRIVKAFVSVSHREWVDIITSQKPMQIYSVPEDAKIGPNPDQFRDCEDIAVKLAFALNSIPEMPKITFSLEKQEYIVYVSDLLMIQEITNRPEINKCLIKTHKDNPLRIKQSFGFIDSVYQLEEKISKQKVLFQALKLEVQYAAKNAEYAGLLTKFGNLAHEQYGEFINELKKYVNCNVDLISSLVATPEHPLHVEKVDSTDVHLTGES